jgi:hypothetical protein
MCDLQVVRWVEKVKNLCFKLIYQVFQLYKSMDEGVVEHRTENNN